MTAYFLTKTEECEQQSTRPITAPESSTNSCTVVLAANRCIARHAYLLHDSYSLFIACVITINPPNFDIII